MPTYRSPLTQAKYDEYSKSDKPSLGCSLCEKPAIKTFNFWKITKNDFPYDKISGTHHMICPLRHVKEEELSKEEMEEFEKIKDEFLHKEYDYIMEATYKIKTIPKHFHLHLIVMKEGM